MLGALAREGPVVVILDDLQWAEPALLDFADQLGMADAGAGILLVCLARPSSGRWQEAEALEPGTVISLAPLPADARGLLAGSFPGLGTMADSELVREAIHSAAGNPLFLEQALALIAGNGAERAAVLPPTAAAVAAARMDRLAPGERSVAQAAAVQGEAFDAGLLAELVPAQARAAVREHLHSLAGQLMIMPDWPACPGRDGVSATASSRRLPTAPSALRRAARRISGWPRCWNGLWPTQRPRNATRSLGTTWSRRARPAAGRRGHSSRRGCGIALARCSVPPGSRRTRAPT